MAEAGREETAEAARGPRPPSEDGALGRGREARSRFTAVTKLSAGVEGGATRSNADEMWRSPSAPMQLEQPGAAKRFDVEPKPKRSRVSILCLCAGTHLQ